MFSSERIMDLSQYHVVLAGADREHLITLEQSLGDDVSTYTETSAAEALDVLGRYPVALLVVDGPLPGWTWIDFLARARAVSPGVRLVVLADGDTAGTDWEAESDGVFAVLEKDAPVWRVRMTVRRGLETCAIADENERLTVQSRRLFMGSLSAISEALDAKDAYTYGHSYRVTQYALAIARQMGLPEMRLGDLEIGGLLHDIGKIGIPESILGKPGRLTEEEFSLVKSHPVRGYRMMLMIPGLENALRVVRHHHERADGSGYPDGLRGEQIPILARVLAVADAYDAMTSNRPYRPAMTHADAIQEVQRNAGKQFDSQVVQAFLGLREMAEVRQVIEKSPDVPVYPAVLRALHHFLQEEQPDSEELIRFFTCDPALAASVLRTARSARFAMLDSAADVRATAAFLGVSGLRRLAVAGFAEPGMDEQQNAWLWKHLLATAICAEILSRKASDMNGGEAYTAGLLHDVGTLLLQKFFPGPFDRVLHLEKTGTEMLPAEVMVFGVDHATVGGWLMEAWGLDPALCDAVRYHHDPFRSTKPMGYLVALANSISHLLDPQADRTKLDGNLMDRFRVQPEELDGILEEIRTRLDQQTSYILRMGSTS